MSVPKRHYGDVPKVSQQLADRLQSCRSCRQYVRDTKVKMGTDGAVAPITPLTSLPAVITENDPPAVKRGKRRQSRTAFRWTESDAQRVSRRRAA
jgi:hypothetical protein